jgi:hypothetical protein
LLRQFPADELPMLSPEQIRQVAFTFALTTSAPDGLPVAALSDECLQALAAQYVLWHRHGWPAEEQHVTTVLISNQRGRRRPAAYRFIPHIVPHILVGSQHPRPYVGCYQGQVNDLQQCDGTMAGGLLLASPDQSHHKDSPAAWRILARSPAGVQVTPPADVPWGGFAAPLPATRNRGRIHYGNI